MTAPPRGNNGYSVYFITASTFQKQSLFQSDRFSLPFIETLLNYRLQRKYLLHEFVVMPNHFHLLLTPTLTLERALQFIKGGFSHRFRKETGSRADIWESSFTNHRIRAWDDYDKHRRYIHFNPVRAGLSQLPQDFPYSSAHPGFALDAAPQRLKPVA